jgi:hypothetical protein
VAATAGTRVAGDSGGGTALQDTGEGAGDGQRDAAVRRGRAAGGGGGGGWRPGAAAR